MTNTFARRFLPTPAIDIVAELAAPPDELWIRYATDYYVSNYGLVVNMRKRTLMPWRLATQGANTYYLVSVNRASYRVDYLVYSAFNNGGVPLSRKYTLNHIDGDMLNVALDNLECVKHTRNVAVCTLSTVEQYAAMLNKRKHAEVS